MTQAAAAPIPSETQAPGPPRVVDSGGVFEGKIFFRGHAGIEGEVRGEVLARGTLWVGPQALVKANVEVDELVLAGRIEGDVTAHQRVELLPGAQLLGSLRTPKLAMAEGSLLEGQCDVITAD